MEGERDTFPLFTRGPELPEAIFSDLAFSPLPEYHRRYAAAAAASSRNDTQAPKVAK